MEGPSDPVLLVVNITTVRKVATGAVALHSLALGLAMLFWPRQTLGLFGWEVGASIFFPAQSGLFLLILGSAYLAGIWHRPFAWFLVCSKLAALAFLLVTPLIGIAPKIVFLTAAGDGSMCALVFGTLLVEARRS